MTESFRFAILLTALAPISSAFATPTISACSAGDAPAAYSGNTCHSVCAAVAWGFGLYTIECDVGTGSPTADGILYAVYDYPDIAAINFSAWGKRSDGTNFCCYIDDSGNQVFEFYLYGSSRADTVAFQESGGESMEDPTTGFFGAQAEGLAGSDYVEGSDETEANFYDYLLGGDGTDEVWGGTGADTLEGNDGADELRGEGGNDTLRGGAGADYLSGAAGDNTMCGGGGTIFAGDDFHSLAGADILWEAYNAFTVAPTGTDTGGSNTCGHTSWGSTWAGTCSYTLTTAPSGC